MNNSEIKSRLKRIIRRRKKQAKNITLQAESSFERYFLRRLLSLVRVKRFVGTWLGLIVVLTIGLLMQNRELSSHYLHVMPAAGGTYREGIVGLFTNASPLFAQSEVDGSMSTLLFSGLFKHDNLSKLVPDLAEKYELDKTETLYTVTLKPNLKWHDGKDLTAKDVVFTYNTIQNLETKSYLNSNWRGVKVTALDDRTVTFKLSNSLNAFPQSLTNGIVPEHILSSVPASQLRSDKFNNVSPIGSGPFKFEKIEVQNPTELESNYKIGLLANEQYHLGKPKIDRFIINTYKTEADLSKAFDDKFLDGASDAHSVSEEPGSLKVVKHVTPLTNEVMAFFKTTDGFLSDVKIRKSMVLTIDKTELFKQLPYPVISASQPILKSSVGYNKTFNQVTNNRDEAAKTLDEAGWKLNEPGGLRSKDGKDLRIRMVVVDSDEFRVVSENLHKQWREVGIEVEMVLQQSEELKASVSGHNYEALLYGISVGNDPDVYAYWHSTQSDVKSETRLNFSEYKSTVADKSLEAGRTRSDEQNRTTKYRPFLEAWRTDSPALALYQSNYIYVSTDQLSGFDVKLLDYPIDRYTNVNNWQIRKTLQRYE